MPISHKFLLQSTAAVLARGRDLVFYDVKDAFLRRLLDATHQRNPEHAPPEIVLDPVEEIGNPTGAETDEL